MWGFIENKSILFQTLPDTTNDQHIESLSIKINNITIVNIYIPPTSSCSAGYIPAITPFLPNDDALILGDFNTHDPLWYSNLSDNRGSHISDEIGNSNFGTLNEEQPTRLPSNGHPSFPDISLASIPLLPYATWSTHTSLGSDHLPIIITLQTDIKPVLSENRTYINFRKANWEDFEKETEQEFEKLHPPHTVYAGERAFRKIINKVSKSTIP